MLASGSTRVRLLVPLVCALAGLGAGLGAGQWVHSHSLPGASVEHSDWLLCVPPNLPWAN